MQTFLPLGNTTYPYVDSAKVLDRLRLNKQRIETSQILKAIETKGGWYNHPCSKQWEPYKLGLATYGLVICTEWISRGYRDSLLPYFNNKVREYQDDKDIYPLWLKDTASSHRAALLAKDYQWYSQFNWVEVPKIDYYWPTKHNDKQQNHSSIF